MSRYSDLWGFRAPVTIDASANTTNSKDVTLSIPADWDEFWDNVEATGADVRVTLADGVTLATKIHLSTWTYATREGVIQIEGVTVTTDNVMHGLWLYWGNAAATTVSTSFVPSTALLSHVWLARSGSLIVTCQGQRPGDTKPRTALMKGTAEVDYIVWNWRPRLLGRQAPYADSGVYEEISYISLAELQDGNGTPFGAGGALASARLIDGGVVMLVQAGSSGTTYTAVCRIVTTLGRTLEERALLKVRNVTE